jgi:hypothetical protein
MLRKSTREGCRKDRHGTGRRDDLVEWEGPLDIRPLVTLAKSMK